MGDPLINRDIAVTVGPLQILPKDADGKAQPILKMTFNVVKTLDSTPNTAKLSIWNLSADSRAKVQEKNVEVLIEAGYLGFTSQIFKGSMDFANSDHSGTEWVTSLEAGDGSKEYKVSRVNESFSAGAKGKDILEKLTGALGLEEGNLKDIGSSIAYEWLHGKVLSGKTSEVMDDVTKAFGLDWSVQDKKLQLLAKKTTTKDPAIVLKPSTGLVGSPQAGEEGKVKAKSLLNGKLFPGRKVTLESKQISGDCRVDKVTHSGDTWGNTWYSDLELLIL